MAAGLCLPPMPQHVVATVVVKMDGARITAVDNKSIGARTAAIPAARALQSADMHACARQTAVTATVGVMRAGTMATVETMEHAAMMEIVAVMMIDVMEIAVVMIGDAAVGMAVCPLRSSM